MRPPAADHDGVLLSDRAAAIEAAVLEAQHAALVDLERLVVVLDAGPVARGRVGVARELRVGRGRGGGGVSGVVVPARLRKLMSLKIARLTSSLWVRLNL